MYRVEWLQSALDELAEVWMRADAPLRQAITQAAHIIEQRLRLNPDEGESREGDERVFLLPPLGLVFEVDQPHRLITILHIWLVRRRPR